jgi:hypothetical protein
MTVGEEEALLGPDEPLDESVEMTDESNTGDDPQETPEPEATPEPEIDFDISKTDPTKLPPEVQKFYKGLQGDYTRKMQGLSQALEGLKTHASRLQLMDRAMTGDENARAELARIVGWERAQAQAHQADEIPDFNNATDLVKFMDQRVAQAVQNAIRQTLESQVAPHLQQVQTMAMEAHQQKQMAEYEATKKDFPDFDNYLPQMVEIRRGNPALTLRQCYQLATYRNPSPPSKIVSKPGARPAAVKDKNDGKLLSFEEAAAAAIKELKRGG